MSNAADKLIAPLIYEEADTSSLHFGRGGAVQSTMSLEAPDWLVFAYTRMMMSFLLFIERPRHIGIIGLGGGSIPKHCYRYLPNTQISVAEISPEVIALRNRFLIPKDDRRFRVHCEDGAEFVKRHMSQFDVLIVDGFDAVFHAERNHAVFKTSAHSPNQHLWKRVAYIHYQYTNEIVCAGKGDVWWKSEDHLKRNQIHIQQHHSIDLRRMVREFVSERESHHPRRFMPSLPELAQEY